MPWESRCSATVLHPRRHFGSERSRAPSPARTKARMALSFMSALYHGNLPATAAVGVVRPRGLNLRFSCIKLRVVKRC